MNNYQPYLHDRLISKHESGFCVIIPKEIQQNVPICCPVCSITMRTKDDEISWFEFNCCNRCSLVWAAPRRKEWNDGWRPDSSQIEIEISQRPPLVIDLDIE